MNNDWDLVVSENGTIKFKETLWQSSNSPYAYDEISSYDQTLYDQSAGIELRNILLLPLECIVISFSLCRYISCLASTEKLPSVIIPVFFLPNIMNSFTFADNNILSEFMNIWSPLSSLSCG